MNSTDTVSTKIRPLSANQELFEMSPHPEILLKKVPTQEDVTVIADYRVAVIANGLSQQKNDAMWNWLLKNIRDVVYAKYPDVFIAVRPLLLLSSGVTDIDLENVALSISRYESIDDLKSAGFFDLIFLDKEEALISLTYIEGLEKTYVVVEGGYAQAETRVGHTLGSPQLVSKLGFLEVVFTSMLKALSSILLTSPDDQGVLSEVLSGFCGSLIGKTPEYTCDIPVFFRRWSTANMEEVQ